MDDLGPLLSTRQRIEMERVWQTEGCRSYHKITTWRWVVEARDDDGIMRQVTRSYLAGHNGSPSKSVQAMQTNHRARIRAWIKRLYKQEKL